MCIITEDPLVLPTYEGNYCRDQTRESIEAEGPTSKRWTVLLIVRDAECELPVAREDLNFLFRINMADRVPAKRRTLLSTEKNACTKRELAVSEEDWQPR